MHRSRMTDEERARILAITGPLIWKLTQRQLDDLEGRLDLQIKADEIRSLVRASSKGTKPTTSRRSYDDRAQFVEDYIVENGVKIDFTGIKIPIALQHHQGVKVLYKASVNVSRHPQHPDWRPLYSVTQPERGEIFALYPDGVALTLRSDGHAGRIDNVIAVVVP